MKMIFLSFLFNQISFASVGPNHIFFCKVSGFDRKSVQAKCDPEHQDKTLKIPREWLAEDSAIATGKPLKLILDDAKLDKWFAMNDIQIAKGAGK